MKLRDYLHEKNMRATAFAKSIGVSPSTITRIVRGETKPSLPVFAKIKDATRGKVKFDDFV